MLHSEGERPSNRRWQRTYWTLCVLEKIFKWIVINYMIEYDLISDVLYCVPRMKQTWIAKWRSILKSTSIKV